MFVDEKSFVFRGFAKIRMESYQAGSSGFSTTFLLPGGILPSQLWMDKPTVQIRVKKKASSGKEEACKES